MGAALTSGSDLAVLPRLVSTGQLPVRPGTDIDLGPLMALASGPADPDTVMNRVIEHAPTADTVEEADCLTRPLFRSFTGLPWPRPLHCTAIDTRSGQLRMWDFTAGVPLPQALAASCSIPGLFPPVTVGGIRYIDGGMRSPLNTTLAWGHQHVVAMSCFPLTATREAADPPSVTEHRQADEMEQLRSANTRVTVIEPAPEYLTISQEGRGIMNTVRAMDAYEAGLGQADKALIEGLAPAAEGEVLDVLLA
ncbi:patatin-like phospholipase family protein [Streptomyces sp. HUAS TT20]|nr:patatin-like phospholipase family protein [Streptomyces sp. HUAS 15-9]UXY32092.1 patatin-like phospholipase family protein [Streptomyces sp. HUAS 15-9]